MSDVRPSYDDINLNVLLETLWNGKFKIIISILLTTLLGLVYIIATPNSFHVSTNIKKAPSSVFLEYESINDQLQEFKQGGSYAFLGLDDIDDEKGYPDSEISLLLTPTTTLNMFIREFKDYEEMANILSKNEFVIESIQHLDNNHKQKSLFQYAKFFDINRISDTDEILLSFTWHNEEEGINLFTKAMLETLENVQKSVINNVELLAASIDSSTQRKLEILNQQLELLKDSSKQNHEIRKRYLLEQSAIAKKLNIKGNKLAASKLGNEGSLELSVMPESIPYYLRGYVAIEKELSLIKERTTDQQLLMTVGYADLNYEIKTVQNDLSSKQLRDAIEDLQKANIENWINFDFRLADSEPKLNMNRIFILSFFLGIILGIFYVLVSNSFSNHKKLMKKV